MSLKKSVDAPELKLFKMEIKKAENVNANNTSSLAPEMKLNDLFDNNKSIDNGQLSKSGLSVNSPVKS